MSSFVLNHLSKLVTPSSSFKFGNTFRKKVHSSLKTRERLLQHIEISSAKNTIITKHNDELFGRKCPKILAPEKTDSLEITRQFTR